MLLALSISRFDTGVAEEYEPPKGFLRLVPLVVALFPFAPFA